MLERFRKKIVDHWLDILLIFLLILLTASLRIYHVERESLWGDEYISFSHTSAPTLRDCLREQRIENWDPTPVYYSLQYFWARMFHGSVLATRCLSILISLLSIPFIYAIGKSTSGRWTGIIACLCYALSPTQIFHARGIRCYALLMLFGLIAAYAFLNAVRRGGARWWILNFTANVLAFWTHPFGALMLPAQGIFLLLFRFLRFRQILIWGAAHLIAVIPLGLWMASSTFEPPREGPKPTLNQLQEQILGRDNTYIRWTINDRSRVAEADLDEFQRVLTDDWQKRDDNIRIAYKICVVAAFAWLTLKLLTYIAKRFKARKSKDNAPPSIRPLFETMSFLFLWAILPELLLFLYSKYGNPTAFQERYVTYASMPLYVFAGVAIEAIPWTLARLPIAAALVTTLGFATLTASVIPTRTDYRSVADFLSKNYKSEETVVLTSGNDERFLQFHVRPTSIPMKTPPGLDATLDEIDSAIDAGRGAWIVSPHSQPEGSEAATCEQYFAARGLRPEKRCFIGMMNITVFHLPPTESGKTVPSTSPEAINSMREALKALPNDAFLQSRLARTLKRAGRIEDAAEEYRTLFKRFPQNISFGMELGHALEEAGHVEEARQAYQNVRAASPSQSARAEADLLMKTNQADDAIAVLRGALEIEHDPIGLRGLHAAIGDIFERTGKLQEAADEYAAAISLHPLHFEDWMYLRYALFLDHLGKLQEALKACESAVELNPNDANAHVQFASMLRKAKDFSKAANELQIALRLHPADPAARQMLDSLKKEQNNVK
jgi:tetratricopeptide (TPR) repeat protein/4-amino-4-deoxy-L-arabinose transferase-like glycosyltransferase